MLLKGTGSSAGTLLRCTTFNEEAATGTSNAALACCLYERLGLEKEEYIFEQGYSLNSPSEIAVKLTVNKWEQVEKVHVGGKGYFCELKYLEIYVYIMR